jgi:HrpA-like RNA helicase
MDICLLAGAGQCYRLYSSDSYRDMMPETGKFLFICWAHCVIFSFTLVFAPSVPEILRSNLSNVVLYLKTLGIDDVLGFDFMEAPDPDQIAEVVSYVL